MASLAQRWSVSRPTKMVVFWLCVASVLVTMIIGFTWGGWVTGGTAREMAKTMAEDAVVRRLAPLCVVRFEQDPGKDQKLKELKEMSTWQRGDFVKNQAWATLPGEKEPDSKVADECAKLLVPEK